MDFDFNTPLVRRGSNCMKWDSLPDGVIPLWVADMDFPVAPAIQRAVQKRASHPVFGYTKVPDSFYDTVCSWMHRRHHWDIDRSWLLYTTGVVPAVSASIKAMTLPGEKVLVMTPVYNCFFSSIRNQGCQIEETRLKRRDNTFEIDFEDLERKCQDDKVTVLLLCNPHNPVGRVWTKDELVRIGEICHKHHVRVISDEIHCEIVMPDYEFIPFAAASKLNQQISVTLNSPSKSFNIAGLQMAYVICSDPELRRRIDRVINIFEVCDVNPFGPVALEAAYNESEDWLEAMNRQVAENYRYLKDFFGSELPQAIVCKLEGTYLVWIDIMSFELTSDEATEKLLNEGKVFVSSGTLYGQQAGQGYLRVNLACPPSTLKEGLIRMARVLSQYGPDSVDVGCPM
jgi:cystathionine beta-lyase